MATGCSRLRLRGHVVAPAVFLPEPINPKHEKSTRQIPAEGSCTTAAQSTSSCRQRAGRAGNTPGPEQPKDARRPTQPPVPGGVLAQVKHEREGGGCQTGTGWQSLRCQSQPMPPSRWRPTLGRLRRGRQEPCCNVVLSLQFRKMACIKEGKAEKRLSVLRDRASCVHEAVIRVPLVLWAPTIFLFGRRLEPPGDNGCLRGRSLVPPAAPSAM